jgi:hypothetical protein
MFVKHFTRRSWSPTRVKTCDEHDSKWPEDWSINMQIFRDSTRKQRSLDSNIQALTVKETTSKAHIQVATGEETGAETGLGRPAWADRPSPFRARFDTPFDLVASRAIYSPLAESHVKIHSSSTTTRPRTRSRLDREGSTCGLHLLRGILHHDQHYNE